MKQNIQVAAIQHVLEQLPNAMLCPCHRTVLEQIKDKLSSTVHLKIRLRLNRVVTNNTCKPKEK